MRLSGARILGDLDPCGVGNYDGNDCMIPSTEGVVEQILTPYSEDDGVNEKINNKIKINTLPVGIPLLLARMPRELSKYLEDISLFRDPS